MHDFTRFITGEWIVIRLSLVYKVVLLLWMLVSVRVYIRKEERE